MGLNAQIVNLRKNMVVSQFGSKNVMPTKVGIHFEVKRTIFGFSPSRVFDPLSRDLMFKKKKPQHCFVYLSCRKTNTQTMRGFLCNPNVVK